MATQNDLMLNRLQSLFRRKLGVKAGDDLFREMIYENPGQKVRFPADPQKHNIDRRNEEIWHDRIVEKMDMPELQAKYELTSDRINKIVNAVSKKHMTTNDAAQP